MSSVALRVLAVIALLGAIATAVVVLDNRSAVRGPSPELFERHPGLEDVRRRIAADSQGGVRKATVQAAPTPTTLGSGSAEPFTAPAPAAPNGYSFTSAPTTLAVAPYRPPSKRNAGVESTQDNTLGWLFADAGDAPLAAIADLAQRMERDWVFGWLRLADGATVQDVRNAVAPLGIDILAATGPLLRSRLPADQASLAAATELPSVSGLGVVPPERKAHEAFGAELHAAPLRQLPVLITLMAHDPDGRWRRALQARGVEVGRFDADIRAYAANVDAAAFDAALQADFVLAIELMGMYQATHDTAVPAMGADAVRFHTDAPGIFRGTGGGAVPIGVMDTGLNINHLDIASHRSSICGANFIYNDHRTEDADLWIDQDGHGTHVTGTIAGNGSAKPRYAGMAPAVAHIRFAKVLSRHGFGPFDSISRGMDFLTRASACGNGSLAAKPLVVNMSLAATSRRWQGRTPSERKLDAVVWAHRQLYVVANANADISGFSNYSAAKNSLSVGAVYDNGDLARFSSWGPTFDGRLAPQLVATGSDVYSARGQGSRGGYVSNSGTSMASPSVAGVAALLLDAVADYREQPALTRARLMASAIKPDAWLDAGGAFPADNSEGPGVLQAQYGLGKASARTSVLQRKRADGWENGAATSTLTAGSYGHQDIVVPAGASRLDLVLAWDEPPADAIGSTVLNDLDLWLDKDADCTAAACGEHASTSRRDNVEWIIVKNPAAGTYRARVVPQRVYTAAPRAGLAWTIIRDASTPSLRLAVEESRPIGPIDELRYRVVLSVSVDVYVAAGVQVALGSCLTKDGMCGRGVEILPLKREDGVEYSPRFPASSYILVGEVGVGERQRVEFNVRLDAEDAVRLYFKASAWNADPAVVSVELDPDDDPETQPPAEVSPPANDHFADAATLDGARGQVDADAVAATVEQGEPTPRLGASSVGSIWYRWTAPIRGATHFGASTGADVAVFQGERIAALTRIGESRWNVSFFAEKGQTYHVRVSCQVNTSTPCEPAQTLHWSQGPRPANDDFAAAVELPDAEGETAGDNRGATLEPGERFGDLVATVWYRWTAPEDGGWRFRTDQARVLVFTGDHVAALRLVSGGNSSFAPLRVQTGVEYRIAVAANESGRAFSLEWGKYERGASADDFANATDLEGTTSSERITVSTGYSVEPREPAQTGVTTRWWGWTAPSSGRFTWRLSDTQNTEIKIAVFTAADSADAEATPSLATLQFLASTGPRVTGTKFAFDAVGGQRYWISAGFHIGDDAAFRWNRSATLRWGETPANDSLAQAIVLDGSSGTTTFASLFGTLEPGERDGILGASSLWWSFTPPKAGWYRFWLDETTSATLAVYRVRGAGFDGLQLVARSHGDWQAPDADDATAVLFDAVAEQRYLIRVGQRGERDDSETTLNWDEANAPTWLRYAGRLRASALGLDAPETSATPALAFEDRGAVLYLATSQGVHILARDAASGTLGQARVANMEEQPNEYGLLWDRGRGKLYMHVGCRGWRQLAPADRSRLALVDEGALEIVTHGDVRPCNVRRGAFLDSTGAFLYHGDRTGVEVYALGETGLTSVQSVAIEGLMHAVSNHAGTRVYATDGDSLQAFTRDENTGELTAAGEVELTVRAVAIAISDDDAYLVALARDGGSETYDLAVEGAVPRRLNNLNAFGNASWRDPDGECGFIAARRGAAAIDAFCRNSAFSAAIRVADESARLAATDYVANWQADRFNNYIPEFKSQALATSPDGQHAYVYSEGDILIFERVGNQPPAQSEDATNASADRPRHGALATAILSP